MRFEPLENMIESDRVNSMSKGELFTRNSIIFVISLAISFAIKRLDTESYDEGAVIAQIETPRSSAAHAGSKLL